MARLTAAPGKFSDADLNNLWSEIATEGFDDAWIDVAKELGYEGFNAVAMRAQIVSYAESKGLSIEELKRDIKRMVLLSIERGNSLKTMVKAMSAPGKVIVTHLKDTYHLIDSVGSSKTTAITLSRVALCFPQATLAWTVKAVNPAVSHSRMTGLSPAYPKQLCHQAFASFMPSSMPIGTFNALRDAHMLFQVVFTKTTWNKKNGGACPSDQDSYDNGIKYFENGTRSALVSDGERFSSIVRWGLVTGSNAGTAVPVKAVTDAQTALGVSGVVLSA